MLDQAGSQIWMLSKRRTISKMLLNLFLLPSLILPVLGQSAYYNSVCYTKFDSKAVDSLPTATIIKAATLTAVRITVTVPSTTIAPSPTTSTAVQDVTTAVTGTAP